MAKIAGKHSGGTIGQIIDHGSTTLPSYTLGCLGQAVSRTTYAALFAIIGTVYGVGDGSTTFNMPNGQALFKRGAGSQTVGGIAMSATHGATAGDAIQGHNHISNSSSGTGTLPGTWFGNDNGGNNVLSSNGNAAGVNAVNMATDGTNGTPRTSIETRPANLAITYAIVYK